MNKRNRLAFSGREMWVLLLVLAVMLQQCPSSKAFSIVSKKNNVNAHSLLSFTSTLSSRVSTQSMNSKVGSRLYFASPALRNMRDNDASSPPPPFENVFVAGGSRGVGRHVVEKLLAQGMSVVALVRTPQAQQELESLNDSDTNAPTVKAVIGDAMQFDSVVNAMQQQAAPGTVGACNAVITTLGGSGGSSADPTAPRVDSVGNVHVIRAAQKLGIPRVLLVTSIGCGSSRQAAPASVFEVLRPVLEAKEDAENLLLSSTTNAWTIVRPGGLKTEPMTGQAILTENPLALGSIHREDVADLVVRALQSERTHGKVLTALDPSISAMVHATSVYDGSVQEFALS